MKQYLLYFSPTGGTKKVANAVAEGMGGEFVPLDLSKPVEHKFFAAEDRCLVAVPSYGGRVPAPVVNRLGELFGNGAKAVLVAVFGNRAIDDTLLELSQELKKVGFRTVAALEAVAQHSIAPQYGAGRPDAQDVAELQQFGSKIREALDADSWNPELELPGHFPYKKYKGVPMQPLVYHGCIGCGICAKACPVGAIPLMNYRTTDSTKCISCMRCVKLCPVHVRRLSKPMTFLAGQVMKKSCSGRKPNKLYL